MYRAIFENAPDAMVFLDDRGAILEANVAATRLFDIPRSNLVGGHLEDHRSRLLAFDAEEASVRFREEGVLSGTVRMVSGTGSVREVEFTLRARVHGDHHLAICRDVTERMEVERSLQLREAQLAQAQAIAQLGHWSWTPGRRAIEVSDQAIRIYGFTPKRIEPTTRIFRQALHPHDRSKVRRALWGAIRRRESFSFDYRIIRGDGAVRTLKQKGEASIGNDGRVRLLGVIRDVTEEKQAEEAREKALRDLAEERAWLSKLIERSPVAFVLLGDEGRRVVFNQRAHELMGGATGRLSLQHFLTAICLPDGSPMAPSRLPSTRALLGASVLSEEVALRREDGTLIPALASAGPIDDESGRRLGAVLVLEDTRALKAIERMREEWTSIVAHDLRQPLTTISTQGQILVRRLRKAQPDLVRPSEHILAAANLLNRMVGDLLDVSTIETRRLSLQLRPVAMEELARKVVERLSQEVPNQLVTLESKGPLPEVHVDPERFEQIFANLLSNAAKYGDNLSEIRVVLDHRDEGLVIEVINEGKGIPAEELPRLFTRFHRATGAKHSRVAGLGLGLYITRGLVEAHGGTISAESEPGRLTTFRITLPQEGLGASSNRALEQPQALEAEP